MVTEEQDGRQLEPRTAIHQSHKPIGSFPSHMAGPRRVPTIDLIRACHMIAIEAASRTDFRRYHSLKKRLSLNMDVTRTIRLYMHLR